ncbi:hypothetical protein [Vibrio sp. LaRot3]|uniref:hypothetical protein n=1 Tax=Vibrio sp. LaRot3 TaxID=2998829 RepID=UPI0022CE2324|nr:hypothetical protein [Vibrio sp. LaRot3]MDA0150663.1 hypothetical protein [Vibrio sp. LaRot3]
MNKILCVLPILFLSGCAATKKYEPAIFEDGNTGAYYTVYSDKWQDWKNTGSENSLLLQWIAAANEYTGNCPAGFELRDQQEQENGDFTATVVCK